MSWCRAVDAAQLGGPPAAVPVRVRDVALVITRDAAGTVHAFHNQCPHQGATVCREPQHGEPALECPNHFWVFDLDGSFRGSRLAFAAGRTPPPDPAKDLTEVPCRVVGDTVEVEL